jgi:hypothetical protein
MLDRLVAEIGLDRSGVDTVVGQLESAGVAQHVRGGSSYRSLQAYQRARPSLEAPLCEWRAAFRFEHERRL